VSVDFKATNTSAWDRCQTVIERYLCMHRNWDPAGDNQYPGAAGGGNFAHRSRAAPCSVLRSLILASTVAIIVVATR